MLEAIRVRLFGTVSYTLHQHFLLIRYPIFAEADSKKIDREGRSRGLTVLLHQVFPAAQIGNSLACPVVWMDYPRRQQVAENVRPS